MFKPYVNHTTLVYVCVLPYVMLISWNTKENTKKANDTFI